MWSLAVVLLSSALLALSAGFRLHNRQPSFNNVFGISPETPTAPEAVENLLVYKRGNNLLGLRWSRPRETISKVDTFTISYQSLTGHGLTSYTIEPTPCAAWPDHFCHTVQHLKHNRVYKIAVSARNSLVPEDGPGSSVYSITKDFAPTPPETLRVVNISSTSLGIKWHHPSFGNVKAFIVLLTETERFDNRSCGKEYPKMEVPVKEEKRTYDLKIPGLYPAATYTVSVSAMTGEGLVGPPQSLTTVTRPPHLPFITLSPKEKLFLDIYPKIIELNESWLSPEQEPDVVDAYFYRPLIKVCHLVLAVSNKTESSEVIPESGIFDNQLNYLLKEKIKEPFYFKYEYNQHHLVDDSVWGRSPSPFPIQDYQTYREVAVQVTEYKGLYNVDLVYSTPTIYH